MSFGKGHAYIIFDYTDAIHLYDAVVREQASIDGAHCGRCRIRADHYYAITLELVEFFNTVNASASDDYLSAVRQRAQKEHDDGTQAEAGQPRP